MAELSVEIDSDYDASDEENNKFELRKVRTEG